jgi:hypothetical protein
MAGGNISVFSGDGMSMDYVQGNFLLTLPMMNMCKNIRGR